jgi:Tol biopolymer transport system component
VTCGDGQWQAIVIDSSGVPMVSASVSPGSSAAVSPNDSIDLEVEDTALYTVPIAGGPRKLLVDTGGHGDTGAWTPDGKQVAYIRKQSGTAVYLVNADGTGNHRVADMHSDGACT